MALIVLRAGAGVARPGFAEFSSTTRGALCFLGDSRLRVFAPYFGVVRNVHEEALAEVFELRTKLLVVAIDFVSTDPPVAAATGARGVDHLQRQLGLGAMHALRHGDFGLGASSLIERPGFGQE